MVPLAYQHGETIFIMLHNDKRLTDGWICHLLWFLILKKVRNASTFSAAAVQVLADN